MVPTPMPNFSVSPIPSLSSDKFYDKDLKFHYILFHQWHIFLQSVSPHDIFFNNAFYKLVKTKFDAWAPPWGLEETLATSQGQI